MYLLSIFELSRCRVFQLSSRLGPFVLMVFRMLNDLSNISERTNALVAERHPQITLSR